MGRFLDGRSTYLEVGTPIRVGLGSREEEEEEGTEGRSLERGWQRRPLGIPSVALLALIALLISPTADGPRATKQGCNDLTLSFLHCLPLFCQGTLPYGT
jgi:hypothetical protein